jgi:tetratricopeptide (TPR) repeat protein
MTSHHPARKAVPFLGCNLLALALACWPAGVRAETPVRPDYYDVESAPRFERRALMHASLYTKSGDFVNAARILEEHLRDHPDQDHPLVRLHLAQNQADAGNGAAARDNYRRAVEMQPALERAWFGLADAAYDLAEFAVAADAFERGYAVDPARPVDVLYYAAASWLMAERPEDAVRVLERLTTDPAQPPQLRWVQAYLAAASRLEKPELAAHALQHLLDANPEDADAWYLRYQYDAARRDFQAAAVALRVVGLLRPLSPAEEKQMGDLLLAAGVAQLASEHYRRGLSPEATPAEVERLASALVAAHETEQALDVLKAALERAPTTRLWSLAGDVHYLREEYAAALDAFAHVAADGDESGRAWLMQGYCALELGRREQALELLARAAGFPEQQDMAQRLIQRAQKLRAG